MSLTEPWSWLKIHQPDSSFSEKHSLQLKADIPQQPVLSMDTHSETGTTVQQDLCAETGSHTTSHEQGKCSVRNGEPSSQDISEHLCYLSQVSHLWDCSLEHDVLNGVC